MAQVKISVLVCDRCGNENDVRRYQIRHDGKATNVDLCAKKMCSGVQDEIIALGGEGRDKRKVVTPDDVKQRRVSAVSSSTPKKTSAARRSK